jgi:DNA-binding transcriptional LysR family regulator
MMDLRKLRHLVVLGKTLNYVRAAEALSITQPTLSRSIQALERELKVQLFDRNRGGVCLTPQGRSIAERATTLLAEAEDLENHARLGAAGEGGRIRFGMAPMPAHALLANVLADRVRGAPKVTNEVVVRDVEPLWEMLVDGEIEFFVSAGLPRHDLTLARTEPLGEFPLSLIVRAGHPLLGTRGRGARGAGGEGAKYPLYRSSWAGLSIPDEADGLVWGPANIVEDFATLVQLTAATDVIWIASAYGIDAEIRAGRLVELMRGRQHIEVKIYTLARRSQSALAKSIIATLRHHVGLISASTLE